jgi:hypothetical protein
VDYAADEGFQVNAADTAPIGRGYSPYCVMKRVLCARIGKKSLVTEETRKRIKASINGNCQFKIRANIKSKTSVWTVLFVDSNHDHQMLEGDKRHCFVKNRKLNAEQQHGESISYYTSYNS